jgi:hypothetical protein
VRLTLSDFLGHRLAVLDDLVERVGDLAVQTGQVGRHAHREVALFQGGQCGKQQLGVEILRNFNCGGHIEIPGNGFLTFSNTVDMLCKRYVMMSRVNIFRVEMLVTAQNNFVHHGMSESTF